MIGEDEGQCHDCGHIDDDVNFCADPDCNLLFHRDCRPCCESCNKPTCEEHTVQFEDMTFCPACAVVAYAEEAEAYREAVSA